MDVVRDIIDLDRYPIDQRGTGSYDACVLTCQTMYEELGACNLQGFIRPRAVGRLQAEAEILLPRGFRKAYVRNAYFCDDDPSLPLDHPRRRFWKAGSTQIANDQIGSDTLIRRLYLWQPLINFIADVEGSNTLYPMADEFQALNIIAHGEDQNLPWHYDTNVFTVTLLLNMPEAGGDFVYAPDIRSDDDASYETVKRLFDGDETLVHRLPRGNGTLTLFRGRYSMHAVEPVRGKKLRVTAIMTYDENPDCRASPELNTFIYGPRVAAIYRTRNNRIGS